MNAKNSIKIICELTLTMNELKLNKKCIIKDFKIK